MYPLTSHKGTWSVPTAPGPGLGIEIDEAAAAPHPFAQERIPAFDAIFAGRPHRQLVKGVVGPPGSRVSRKPIQNRSERHHNNASLEKTLDLGFPDLGT